MASNCLDFLNNYADYLSANTDPTISGVRPHPIFFTGINCEGSSLPPPNGTQALEPTDGEVFTVPGALFGSFYIPSGWTIVLNGTNTQATYPQPTAQKYPVLYTNTGTLFFPNGSPIFNGVSSVVINMPRQNDGVATYTQADWQYQMCLNEISTLVGARHILSWQAGSTECDAFMDTFCADVATLSCLPNSTQPAPLPDNKTACVCLVEENCLKQTFCEPGNTNPSCSEVGAFEEFIPVTCFGKNCSIEGYRWARMQSQRCTVTLCQQIINLVGDNIVVKGGSTIWCGNRNVSLTPTPSISVTPTPGSPADSLPLYAWLLIGVAVFLIAIVTPIAVLVYRQAHKKRLKDLQNLDTAHE